MCVNAILSQSAPWKRTAQVLILTQENAVQLQSLGAGPLSLAATVGGVRGEAGVRVNAGSYYCWVKVNQSVTGLEWPRGFQEFKVPRFHDKGTGWR